MRKKFFGYDLGFFVFVVFVIVEVFYYYKDIIVYKKIEICVGIIVNYLVVFYYCF